MFNKSNTKQRFSLRKYTFGAASVLLGTFFVASVGDINVLPNAHVAKAAETTVGTSAEFVQEWNKPADKTINLNPAGYTGTVIESQNNNSTTLVNNSTTTVNGNGQDLTLRQMSIDNQKDLTIKNTDINVVADPGLANPSISSSGNLTLENVTTPGTVKPDLNVTGGTATVKSTGEGTEFKSANVSGGATLTLEGSKIDIPVVKADATSKVVSNSERVDEYQGGNVTLNNLTTADVKINNVNSLTLDASNITLAPNSNLTLERLEVKAGSVLNIGDNPLNVNNLFGTGKIIMSPAATLRVRRLEDAINVEVTNPTKDWGTNATKDYVVVETPVAKPTVTATNTPVGKKIDSENNVWKLVDDTKLNTTELNNLVTEADTSADIAEKLKTATPELTDRYNKAFQNADGALIDAKTQDEINAAFDELKKVIAELTGAAAPTPAPTTPAPTAPAAVEKGTVTVEYIDAENGNVIIPKEDVVRDVEVGKEYTTTAYPWLSTGGNPLTPEEVIGYLKDSLNSGGVYFRVEDKENEPKYKGLVTAGTTDVVYKYELLKSSMNVDSKYFNARVRYVNEEGLELKANQVDSYEYSSEERHSVENADTVHAEDARNLGTLWQHLNPGAFLQSSYVDLTRYKDQELVGPDGKVYVFSREKENSLVKIVEGSDVETTLPKVDGSYTYDVVLEYTLKDKPKGSVTVSYVDVDSGQEIIPKKDVVRDVAVGTDYTTEGPLWLKEDGTPIKSSSEAVTELDMGRKGIYVRVTVDTDDEPSGKVTAGEKHVQYGYVYFKRQIAGLIDDNFNTEVRYVDTEGKTIKDPVYGGTYLIRSYAVAYDGIGVPKEYLDKQHDNSFAMFESHALSDLNNKYGGDLFTGAIDESRHKLDTITFEGKVYEFVSEKENKLVDTLTRSVAEKHSFGIPYPITLEYRLKTEEVAEGDAKVTKKGSLVVKFVDENGVEIKNAEKPFTDQTLETVKVYVRKSGDTVISSREEKSATEVQYSTKQYAQPSILTADGKVYDFVKLQSGLEEGSLAEGLTEVVYAYKLRPTEPAQPKVENQVPKEAPTVELPEGNVSVSNLPGQTVPTVELPEGNVSVSNLPGQTVPTVSLPEGNVSVSNLPGQTVPTVSLPEGNITLPNPPGQTVPTQGQPGNGVTNPAQSGQTVPTQGQPGNGVTTPTQPGQPVPTQGQPGSGVTTPTQSGQPVPTQGQPGNGVTNPTQSGQTVPTQGQPGNGVTTPAQSGQTVPTQGQPGNGVTTPAQSGQPVPTQAGGKVTGTNLSGRTSLNNGAKSSTTRLANSSNVKKSPTRVSSTTNRVAKAGALPKTSAAGTETKTALPAGLAAALAAAGLLTAKRRKN